ncbi:MAG: metallophosphoesterase family protein [Telluria sp.]
MRTLVHLSDLHFGRVDAALLAPLSGLVNQLRPDVVVVSGDLTQRATSEQFEQARDWLDTLPGPQIIVPGNHDISLFNVFRRFAQPLDRYQRYITEDLAPAYVDDEIAVLGINTARSLTWKDGRINREQVGTIKERFGALPPEVVRIVVTHHPFDLPDGHENEGDLVERAEMAMDAFADCGVDVLLSGHLHASQSKSTADRYQLDNFAALVVQAGTATSTRGRGEVNSFNVLRIGQDRIDVERFGWDVLSSRFSLIQSETFMRTANVWAAHSDGLYAAGI